MPTAKKEAEVPAITPETVNPTVKVLLDAAKVQQEALVKLVAELASVEGQQSVILRNAMNEVLGFENPYPVTVPDITTIGDLAIWLDAANKYAATLADESRSALLKSRSSGSDTGAALLAKYKSDREAYEAHLLVLSGPMVTALGAPTVAFVAECVKQVPVPDRRTKTVSKDGSVSKKLVQFGRTLADGTDRPMSDAQNTNGHMRQQFARKFTDQDVDIAGWRELIRNNGNPEYNGNSDEYSLTDKAGVKYWAKHITA